MKLFHLTNCRTLSRPYTHTLGRYTQTNSTAPTILGRLFILSKQSAAQLVKAGVSANCQPTRCAKTVHHCATCCMQRSGSFNRMRQHRPSDTHLPTSCSWQPPGNNKQTVLMQRITALLSQQQLCRLAAVSPAEPIGCWMLQAETSPVKHLQCQGRSSATQPQLNTTPPTSVVTVRLHHHGNIPTVL